MPRNVGMSSCQMWAITGLNTLDISKICGMIVAVLALSQIEC